MPVSVGRFGWLIGATVLVSCLSAPVAQSSFPGQNGRLAFDFETRCGLKDIAKMRPDGSDLRFLTPNACKRYRTDYDEPERIAPDWSPDGRRLLFLQEADYSAGPPMLMAANGSERKRIRLFRPPAAAGLGWGEEKGVKPSFAPDGRHFAYTRERECFLDDSGTSSTEQIWRAALDGSRDRPLRDGTNPRWSPSGDLIAYWRFGPTSMRMTRPPISVEGCSSASEDRGGNGLWLMNARTGRDIRRLAPGAAHWYDESLFGGDLDWSPSGRAIVYADDNGRLWIARADGRGRRRLHVTPAAYKGRPVWSPDGQQIAFVTTKEVPPKRGCTEDPYDDEGECDRWRFLISLVSTSGGNSTRIYTSPAYSSGGKDEPPMLSWQPG